MLQPVSQVFHGSRLNHIPSGSHKRLKARFGFRQQSSGFRQPQNIVGDAFRCDPLAVFHANAMKEGICVAIVVKEAFGKVNVLVGLLLYLVAKMPQHTAHGPPALQHKSAAGQIGIEATHEGPPGLFAEKRRADVTAERCTGEVVIGIGVVCVRMEHGVRNTLDHVLVGHLAEHARVFIPSEVERCERFG